MARKPIGNKLRFEVFKRDCFTCQYCGKKAPEIILRVDHINPVKNGGDSNILNLITSCFECNSGKGATLLKDNTLLEKQRTQLEELQERKVQLEMMVDWRTELMNVENDSMDIYLKKINNLIRPHTTTEEFKIKFRKVLKESKPDAILYAIQESFDRHASFENSCLTIDSANLILSKIKGIARFKSLDPIQQKKQWLCLVANKKYLCSTDEFNECLDIYVSLLVDFGYSEHNILNDLQEGVKKLIYNNREYWGLMDDINNWRRIVKGWIEEKNNKS